MSALRRLWRLPALAALLLGGLLYQLLAFPLIGVRGRERAIRRWARMLLAVSGVRLRMRQMAAGGEPSRASTVAGAERVPRAGRPGPLPGGCLVVANHLSWLDIFVIHSFAPARFVAKAEMRGWPVIGLLCALAGTLFIERHRRHAVRDVVHRAAAALRAGHRVGVFPEGTTGDGTALLRFHANLLQAAIEARAPLVPVALRYLDAEGRPSQAARFVGDTTFAQSVWWVAGEPVTLAEVAVLAPLEPTAAPTRHMLAHRVERAIGEALGLPAAR